MNRKNIRKDKNEMDLLNANDRRESEMNGLSDQEQYFETRNTNNMNSYNRASTGFHKLSSSGRRDPLETTHVSIHVISSNLSSNTGILSKFNSHILFLPCRMMT